MNWKLIIVTSLAFFSFYSGAQEVLISPASNVKDEAMFSRNDKLITGRGFFPVTYSEATMHFPMKDTLKSRSWAHRKLFKEHFIQQNGNWFYLAIDPLFDMNMGKEFLQKNEPYIYQNTRGAQAFGDIGTVFSFYTAFYENQARFLDYQSEYFDDRGEIYTSNGNNVKANAVIPNGGRTKPFKTDGYDYASAISYVRLSPIKQLAIQFGNAPRFFGYGHRSMLLSDNSYNYTHLSIDWEIIPGLTYTFMRGKQLNLIRKSKTNFVEAPYERKGIGIHYLSYSPIPSLILGLFESTVYLRDKEGGDQRVNPMFYQPVLGLNTVAKGGESRDMKNLIGLNLAWKFHAQHMVYAQFMTDNFSKLEYGLQVGYRTGNPFGVKNLYFQAEFNKASSHLYSADNARMNYTHFNMPLAHTLGNDFNEVVIRASYNWKGIYAEGTMVYYESAQSMGNKSNLFSSKSTVNPLDPIRVMYGNFELGYEFNRATRLRVFASASYRKTSHLPSGSHVGLNKNYGAVTVGIRSALRNQYFDF